MSQEEYQSAFAGRAITSAFPAPVIHYAPPVVSNSNYPADSPFTAHSYAPAASISSHNPNSLAMSPSDTSTDQILLMQERQRNAELQSQILQLQQQQQLLQQQQQQQQNLSLQVQPVHSNPASVQSQSIEMASPPHQQHLDNASPSANIRQPMSRDEMSQADLQRLVEEEFPQPVDGIITISDNPRTCLQCECCVVALLPICWPCLLSPFCCPDVCPDLCNKSIDIELDDPRQEMRIHRSPHCCACRVEACAIEPSAPQAPCCLLCVRTEEVVPYDSIAEIGLAFREIHNKDRDRHPEKYRQRPPTHERIAVALRDGSKPKYLSNLLRHEEGIPRQLALHRHIFGRQAPHLYQRSKPARILMPDS